MLIPKIFQQFDNVVAGVALGHFLDEKLGKHSLWDQKLKNAAQNILVSTLGPHFSSIAPKQIHSDIVHYVEYDQQAVLEGDGLWTKQKDLLLVNYMADCVIALIYADVESPFVAGIHSGWRGTHKKIIPQFLHQQEINGIAGESLFVYLAPSICGGCYEFGKEVFDLFDEKYITTSHGKHTLDVQQNVYDQFIEYGVPSSNIEVSTQCTYHDEGYYSYRKEGAVGKRMVTAIGLL